MTKNRIVILEFLTFGLEYLVEAIIKKGYTPTLLSKDPSFYNFSLSKIDKLEIITVNTLNITDVLAVFDEIKDSVAGFISSTDTFSNTALAITEKYNLPFLRKSALLSCRNKDIAREKSKQANLFSIKASIVNEKTSWENIIKEMHPPFIIKDSSGTGSANVFLANNKDDFNRIIKVISTELLKGEILVEEYIEGTLFSAESITFKNETKVLAITGRFLSAEPEFRELMLATPITFDPITYTKIVDFIKNTLKALDYDRGFSHTEFILKKDGICALVEVNPRIGGVLIGQSLSEILNINVYEAMLDCALDIRPQLMDHNLDYTCAKAMYLLYPEHAGTYCGILGKERLASLPANPTLFPVLKEGSLVSNMLDQRSCVSILETTATNSELALYHLVSALNKIKVHME